MTTGKKASVLSQYLRRPLAACKRHRHQKRHVRSFIKRAIENIFASRSHELEKRYPQINNLFSWSDQDDDDDTNVSGVKLLHTLLREANVQDILDNTIVSCIQRTNSNTTASPPPCNVHGNVRECLKQDPTYPYVVSPRALALINNNVFVQDNKYGGIDHNAFVLSSSSYSVLEIIFQAHHARVPDSTEASVFTAIRTQIINSLTQCQHTHPALYLDVLGSTYPRKALRGQRGVFTKRNLPIGTFLGIYGGALLTEKDMLRWFDFDSVGANFHQLYALSMDRGELVNMKSPKKQELLVYPLGGTDMLHMINDARVNPFAKKKSQRHRMKGHNTEFILFRFHTRIYAGAITIAPVEKGEELALDYGCGYWDGK